MTLQYFLLVSVLNIKQKVVTADKRFKNLLKIVNVWSNLLKKDTERCPQHYLHREPERHINVDVINV